MNAKIIKEKNDELTLQVTLKLTGSMLDMEEAIQSALNKVGVLATEQALEKFDTDGSVILMGGIKFYANHKKMENTYETPYGRARIGRYIYQTSKGGRMYCPLEVNARIINDATPKFAKIISSKYATMGGERVSTDLEENHNRSVAKSYIQDVSELVGSIALAKEESWHYEVPKLDEAVKTTSFGLDGTTMNMADEGKREAMVGTLALYDFDGERLHTIYLASAPEYGKETFLKHFEAEMKEVKSKYPDAIHMGIADGARINWPILTKYTDKQIVDFYHTSTYVNKVAELLYETVEQDQEKAKWLDERMHKLKHQAGYPKAFLKELEKIKVEHDFNSKQRKILDASISYFTNNSLKMDYAECVEAFLPIGSGVTEAACKVIVKQRMCSSGMKWKEPGAKIVLTLRALNYSTDRWPQFWSKLNQYGVPQDLAHLD
jgi:hypothetical protein